MTNAAVRDAVYGMGAISNISTARTTESTQSKEYDFGKIMSQVKDKAQQTVHQPQQQMAEKKNTSQSQETQKTDERYEVDRTAPKEDVNKKEATEETTRAEQDMTEKTSEALKEESVGEELEEAVEDTVEEIMQEVEETLEVSEEELLDIMEQLGMQPIDLLNPDNMATIMTALTGEDSTIQLVMDEDMYLTLQDLMQMVNEKVQELLNASGLSEDELEAVMDQLKLLIDQQMAAEEGNMDEAQILSFEQAKAGELTEDGNVPIMVENDTDMQETQNTELTQETAQEAVKSAETGNSQDSLFQQQQQNMQGFQNLANEIGEMVQENKLQGSATPNTESILKQLADYVKIHNGKEMTEMELQLHPASLGNVKVLLATKAGMVTAQLTTENEIVKNAIESQIAQLKQNLEEQGVRVEAIEVSVASHQMERNLEQNAGDRPGQEQTEETNRIHKVRKTSINLNSFEDEDEILEEMTGADDATRIAMEMMAIGGNKMDLLA